MRINQGDWWSVHCLCNINTCGNRIGPCKLNVLEEQLRGKFLNLLLSYVHSFHKSCILNRGMMASHSRIKSFFRKKAKIQTLLQKKKKIIRSKNNCCVQEGFDQHKVVIQHFPGTPSCWHYIIHGLWGGVKIAGQYSHYYKQ